MGALVRRMWCRLEQFFFPCTKRTMDELVSATKDVENALDQLTQAQKKLGNKNAHKQAHGS